METQRNVYRCKSCRKEIPNRKDGQKFCSDACRYAFHRAQRFSPGEFDKRVRAIVREELKRAGVPITEDRAIESPAA
jgi:hypothetical protein